MEATTRSNAHICAHCNNAWDRKNSDGWGGITLNCAPFDGAGPIPMHADHDLQRHEREFCSPTCLLEYLKTDPQSKVHIVQFDAPYLVPEISLEKMEMPDWMRKAMEEALKHEKENPPSQAEPEYRPLVSSTEQRHCPLCRKEGSEGIGIGTCYGSIWDALVVIYFCSVACLIAAFQEDAADSEKHNLGKWYATKS